MSLTGLSNYLKKNNIQITEGYTQSMNQQCLEIIDILQSNSNILNIMEIGFNAGHSSELFLSNSNAYVYSFDLGEHFHQYLKYGKKYINTTYPNRHTLIFGDSNKTVPKFAENNTNIKFDLIFIDGGHDYDVAYNDLINCRKLANENTFIIMDDIVANPKYQAGYTIGPTNAWNNLINNNLLIEKKHTDYIFGRGQSIGHYINI